MSYIKQLILCPCSKRTISRYHNNILGTCRYLCDKSDKNSEVTEISQQSNNSKENAEDNKVVQAKEKLANLLNTMKIEDSLVPKSESLSQQLGKPKKYIRRNAREVEPIQLEEGKDETEVIKNLDKRLVMAAKLITSKMSGTAATETESQLLRMLRTHAEEVELAKGGVNVNLRDLVEGMKVDHSKPEARPGQIRKQDSQQASRDVPLRRQFAPRKQLPRVRERVNIYDAEPLNIFDENMTTAEDVPQLDIWNDLLRIELDKKINFAPNNPYEEMIKWTEDGKLWNFPIDNEQGLDEEAKVPFYEHVLLDQHLEGLPESGPVRQFMELVLIGLSQNPYLTIERKKASIEWYKNFFYEREEVLRTAEAWH